MTDATEVLGSTRVIPLITIDRSNDVLAVADALLDGGLSTLEVALRTPAGLSAIERLRRERPELTVGAGTVWTPEQFEGAVGHGAQFVVSPGTTDALFAHAQRASVAWLPGGQTVSELARIHQAGYSLAKFFPAEAAGGISSVAAVGDVLPGLELCPTGGIDATRAGRYLALPNVRCVAGSWIAPRAAIEARQWAAIATRARAAASYG
jgi:Entner-Doudoroff aldolase